MCKICSHTKTSKTTHIVAAIIGLALLVVVLFSALYIVSNSNHDCTGEHCPICACIHQCENNIRQFGGGTVAQTLPVLLIACFLLPILLNVTDFSQATLVTQKVRLNH